jgi:hypothetical protein
MAKSEKKQVEKTTNEAQVKLMGNLKEMLPAHLSLVETIGDLFKISNDSAYRRIRGETPLTIEEIALLCTRFNFSFDNFVNSGNTGIVNFFYKPIDPNFAGFAKYINSIYNDLSKMLAFDEKQIIFAGEDIPIFHHFALPHLTAFKIFYWTKSILNSPELEEKKFAANIVSDELIAACKKVNEVYSQIPSVEIWSEDTVNSTLLQIEYFWESGLFATKDDALQVCTDFETMMQHIKKQAELNFKYSLGTAPSNTTNNFTLYQSDITIGNNCILVSMGANKGTYLSYHTLNTMLTTNTSFCSETDTWLKTLMKKSTQISGVAEKQRNQFFKRIDDKLKKIKEKIERE